jgi:putative peptidoglycan lipid II flippase
MLLKAGAVSLALLLASRVLGLVRESAQAAAFGTSAMGDVAVLMLTLPDWLASLVAGGALAYVLLPHWARQPAGAQAHSQRQVAVWLLAGGAALSVGLWLAQDHAVKWLAPGLPLEFRGIAVSALAWSGAAVPLALLAVLWTTRLQYERDFAGMYAANLIVNLILIGALAALVASPQPASAANYLGMALMLAMLARLGWLGWRQHVPDPAEGAAAQALATPMPHADVWLWAVLSAGLPLALPFVARSMTSVAGEGELATFNYAWKLVELPLVLAIQLAASLSFPAIAKAFADDADPAPTVRQAFALTWALACAAAAGLLVGAPAVAQLLFGWGRMTPDSVQRLAGWAMTGAWSLLPQALIAVTLTVLAARDRMRPAVLAYAAGLGALLLTAAWSAGNGGRLMLVLDAVLAGVAVACVAALGQGARQWLPWRAMLAPLAVLLALWGLRALWPGISVAGIPVGLGLAACASVLVLASGWLASGDLRRALRP